MISSKIGAADSDTPSPWETLIARGKEEGYVTLGEVLGVFNELQQIPPDPLEPVLERFRQMGIDVLP